MVLKKNSQIVETSLSKEGIFRLNMNNPTNLNALSENMIDLMQKNLDDASSNAKIKYNNFSGRTNFSSGHDLKEIKAARKNPDKGKNFYEKIMKKCSKMMVSIVNNPKPIIAQVGGTATAAGCQLVASCDLAYANKLASLQHPV